MSEPLHRCDVCGAGVFHARILCPQCGVDLEEPAAPLAWPRTALPFVPRAEPVTKRVLRLAGVVLLTIGLVAVVMVLTQVVGGSDDDALVMPTAQREAGQETLRAIAKIGTRGSDTDSGSAGSAEAMLDGDTATAWFGEAPVLGFVAREQIVLRLDEPAWVSRLVIANGVHETLGAYDAHGRIRTVEVVFDGGITHTAVLLDIGRITQQILLPEPVLTTSLKMTVLGVYPGQEHRDVAVTALDVLGYEPTQLQQQLATERAKELPAVAPAP